MIRILVILAFFFISVVLIGRFLEPDSLAKCPEGPSEKSGCEAVDVIVAVSGGDTAARTVEAVKLYHEGWAPQLVFSGAAQDEDSPSNAAVMRDIAIASGVPTGAISIDEYGRTTKQNAEETADLLKSETISSMILVTSGYHQRRASLEFGRRFKGVEIRSHPVSQDSQWSRWWWLTPYGWYLAIGELARILFFYMGITR